MNYRMVPPLSTLSLALCHEASEGGGYQQMGTIKYAKRNFPSCSLRSQFTASQKPPLLFPNAKMMEPYTGKQLLLSHITWLAALAMQCDTPKAWSHQIRKKKLPLLLTTFAIRCLTKATAFVPQCEKNGANIRKTTYD